MKIPSLAEIMTFLNGILEILVEGGPKALGFLFVLNLAILGGFVYFFIKFFMKIIKEHSDDKEKALAAKDVLLNNARERSEVLNEQYAKLLTQSIDREQMLTNEVRELKTLVTVFLTGSTNNRMRSYSRDDDDEDEEKASKKPRRRN